MALTATNARQHGLKNRKDYDLLGSMGHLRGRDRRISVSSKPAWSTERVPGELGLNRDPVLGDKRKRKGCNWPRAS